MCENRIRSIHSSLAIENNSLTVEQVTAIINAKRVPGNPVEIREVRNAYDAYEALTSLNVRSVDDLLAAHGLMMDGLIPDNGKFRSTGVGIYRGDVLIHSAPPADMVRGHILNLFGWYAESGLHPLIKSAVFHSEFEFIHPFSDGNGRTGRFWHTLLLAEWNELFLWMPIEEIIRSRQSEYYEALGASDCTGFAELMLDIINDCLDEFAWDGTD